MKSSSAESAASTLRSRPVDNGDIVVKDKNGGYELDIPILPPTLESDGDEISGGDEARASAGAGAAGTDSTGDTEISGREKESMLITYAFPVACADMEVKRLKRAWLR